VATEVIATPTERPAWWRDERKRGLVAQIATVLAVVGLFWFLIGNMLQNQKNPLSFDFLSSTAGFQVSFSLIPITLDSDLPRWMGSGAWSYHLMAGYTSVGVGSSILPVRLNCPPEITLHRLDCA